MSLLWAALLWASILYASEQLSRFAQARANRIAQRSKELIVQDVLVDNLPLAFHHASWAPDAFQVALTIAWAAAIFTIFEGDGDTIANHVKRVMAVSALLCTGRALVISSTISGLACPNAAVKRGGTLNAGLHDLMWSGHTAFGTLLMTATAHAAWRGGGSLILFLPWAVTAAAANGVCQCVVGDHWTADVLVAHLVTVPWALIGLEWGRVD